VYEDWLPMYRETLMLTTLLQDLISENFYEVLANIAEIHKTSGGQLPDGLSPFSKTLLQQLFEVCLLRLSTQVSKQLNFIILPEKGESVDQEVLKDTNVQSCSSAGVITTILHIEWGCRILKDSKIKTAIVEAIKNTFTNGASVIAQDSVLK